MQEEVVFIGSEVEIIRIYSDSPRAQKITPITLSAWSPSGIGKAFGDAFFRNANVEAIFVVSKSNHWWHSKELLTWLHELFAAEGRNFFFYGASMGAYGSLHLSRRFDVPGICCSPQVFVVPSNIVSEKRWVEDRAKIIPIFDEIESLELRVENPVYCFFDRNHDLDYVHQCALEGVSFDNKNLFVVDVPYSDHTTVRTLAMAGIIQTLLLDLSNGQLPNVRSLRVSCRKAFLNNPKSVAKYLARGHRNPGSKNFRDLLSLSSGAFPKDFEFHYLLAEAYSRLGDATAALCHSAESVSLNERDYTVLKHASMLEMHTGRRAASNYISKFRNTKLWCKAIEDRYERLSRNDMD